MELQKQVTSLEISQRLKELGVKQESLHFYVAAPKIEAPGWHLYQTPKSPWTPETYWSCEFCSAFTVAELGEIFPIQILWKEWDEHRDEYLVLNFSKQKAVFKGEVEKGKQTKWNVSLVSIRDGKSNHYESSDTEADARGKMLCYLLENKLITL